MEWLHGREFQAMSSTPVKKPPAKPVRQAARMFWLRSANFKWNGQTYSLWKADKNWTLTAEGGVHEDHIAISGCPRSAIGIVC